MSVSINKKKYILSISFANYLKDKTGMPKVIMAHQNMYNEIGVSYVNLFSVKKNICNDKIMLFCMYGLIVDGEYKGIYQMSQLIKLFCKWNCEGNTLLDIHIHHLLYTKISSVRDMLYAFKGTPIKVYLHDYYNACSNYTLMKNKEVYCGGLGLFEKNCNNCSSYIDSKRIENKIHALYGEFVDSITFVSPSEATKNIFGRFHPEYVNKTIVIPHQKFDERFMENLEIIGNDEKIRVAYLGMPARHKGWKVWEQIVKDSPKDRYVFTVFNSSDDTYLNMEKVKIGFSKDNLNAMTDALRKYKAHVVVLWALWPETYSYTCFEAFSANAFLITGKDSGNIADVIRKNKNGLILNDEKELRELFACSDELKKIINSFRAGSVGGPLELYENDEIVKVSMQNKIKTTIVNYVPSAGFVNYPLIYILNVMFDKGKI